MWKPMWESVGSPVEDAWSPINNQAKLPESELVVSEGKKFKGSELDRGLKVLLISAISHLTDFVCPKWCAMDTSQATQGSVSCPRTLSGQSALLPEPQPPLKSTSQFKTVAIHLTWTTIKLNSRNITFKSKVLLM